MLLNLLTLGMRILVMLLLDTLPMLGNVLLLCFFVFFIFGIIGVQLWEGNCLINSQEILWEEKISLLLIHFRNTSTALRLAIAGRRSKARVSKTFQYFLWFFFVYEFICLTIYVHINFSSSSSSLFKLNFFFTEYNLKRLKIINREISDSLLKLI